MHASEVSVDLLLAYRPPDPGPTNTTSSVGTYSSGGVFTASYFPLPRTLTQPPRIVTAPRIVLHTARQASRGHRAHRAQPSATDSSGDADGEPAPSWRLRAAA